MIRAAALLFLLPVAAQDPVRFTAIEIVLDTGGKPLAAWQVEIACDASRGRIVGVEGGEAFKDAPWYDPAALHGGGRIVLAAFTEESNPPAGKVRVARVHFEERGDVAYTPKLVVAGAPGGERLAAKIELVRVGEKK